MTTSPANLTSPVCTDAQGRDWTSDEAKARRAMKAWARLNGRRQEEPKIRELQASEGGLGWHTIGDENCFDLEIDMNDRGWFEIDQFATDEVVSNLMGVETSTNIDLATALTDEIVRDEACLDAIRVLIDTVGYAQAMSKLEEIITITKGEDEDGPYVDIDMGDFPAMVEAYRTVATDPLVTQCDIPICWLVGFNGAPLGVNGLATIEQAIDNAEELDIDWRLWIEGDEDEQCTAMHVVTELASRLQGKVKRVRAQAERAERQAKAQRKAAERAERQAKAQRKAAERETTQKVETPKVETDWMGRVQGPSGEAMFQCTGRRYVPPATNDQSPFGAQGPTEGTHELCQVKGSADYMYVGSLDSMWRRQNRNVVEVWHLANHALCPSCMERISRSVARKNGGNRPFFQTVSEAIDLIEAEERKLENNNTFLRTPGMDSSMRASRFAVKVDWAADDAWKTLANRAPNLSGAQWAALRHSLQLGTLDLTVLTRQIVPGWEVDGDAGYIGYWLICKLERDQVAWQNRQRERSARKNARNRHGRGQSHEAPWMR